ncbi:hypothetical protein LIPSTDRAFT_239447 [Lipomyces starkeyi NRRL Y-11557]|uniref:Uncharacterized protein n=1 Tax=Lipomyces starkeyi NRRL Y-11557 TaxID=675824 RepID=A0A1E3QBT4_LIPST|nr:hypothetical protein LIPSTDRAFT_239447 [Lipomyces starkeyi NRRL Y-11557]
MHLMPVNAMPSGVKMAVRFIVHISPKQNLKLVNFVVILVCLLRLCILVFQQAVHLHKCTGAGKRR